MLILNEYFRCFCIYSCFFKLFWQFVYSSSLKLYLNLALFKYYFVFTSAHKCKDKTFSNSNSVSNKLFWNECLSYLLPELNYILLNVVYPRNSLGTFSWLYHDSTAEEGQEEV